MQRSSREQVLDAVADSVRAVGVRRTTMAEIARRAGLSRSTLYTHFADVREATAALLTRELLSLLARHGEDGEDGEDGVDGVDGEDGDTDRGAAGEPGGAVADGRHRLVARAVLLARVVPDDPLIERILELDGELLVPYLVHRLGSSQKAILDAVTDQVRAGQADGSIRSGDPAAIAFTVFLVSQSFVISARIAEAEHGREVALAELHHVLHRSLAP
jgi:AcrR family transcriptional regulator